MQKKIVAFLLSMVFIMSLCSCGKASGRSLTINVKDSFGGKESVKIFLADGDAHSLEKDGSTGWVMKDNFGETVLNGDVLDDEQTMAFLQSIADKDLLLDCQYLGVGYLVKFAYSDKTITGQHWMAVLDNMNSSVLIHSPVSVKSGETAISSFKCDVLAGNRTEPLDVMSILDVPSAAQAAADAMDQAVNDKLTRVDPESMKDDIGHDYDIKVVGSTQNFYVSLTDEGEQAGYRIERTGTGGEFLLGLTTTIALEDGSESNVDVSATVKVVKGSEVQQQWNGIVDNGRYKKYSSQSGDKSVLFYIDYVTADDGSTTVLSFGEIVHFGVNSSGNVRDGLVAMSDQVNGEGFTGTKWLMTGLSYLDIYMTE